MKYSILLAAFLMAALSCSRSPKPSDFKNSLDQAERDAFEIILGKEGPGEKKLQCLAQGDYKGALTAADQQSRAFDKLIAGIDALSAEGIPEGGPLKTASLEYYRSLKELHAFDSREIKQQALLQTLKGSEAKNAGNALMELARQKKMLYAAVYKKEALLHAAAESFKNANGF